MVDTDSNYITAVPIKSRRAEDLVAGYKACYKVLLDSGLRATLIRLDNEASQLLIKAIESNSLDYQLASPGDHRTNFAERAIQSFKNHFISTLSATDPSFPPNG